MSESSAKETNVALPLEERVVLLEGKVDKLTKLLAAFVLKEATNRLKMYLMHNAEKELKVPAGRINIKKGNNLKFYEDKLLGTPEVPAEWKVAIRATRFWAKHNNTDLVATAAINDGAVALLQEALALPDEHNDDLGKVVAVLYPDLIHAATEQLESTKEEEAKHHGDPSSSMEAQSGVATAESATENEPVRKKTHKSEKEKESKEKEAKKKEKEVKKKEKKKKSD